MNDNRRWIHLEAIPFALMMGLTEAFMIPYALALGASAMEAGFLSVARNMLMSLVQLYSARAVTQMGSRRRLVLWTVAVQTLTWMPLAALAWMQGPWRVYALIGFYTLGTVSAALSGPAWGSLVSEAIAPTEQGQFFGEREWRVALLTLLGGMTAGVVLQSAGARPLWAFSAICAAALVARAVSWVYLHRLRDSSWARTVEEKESLLRFIIAARTDNFSRFTIFFSFFSFAVHFTSPYLVVYLIKDLQLSYLTYTVVALLGSMVGGLAIRRWGQVADKRGNQIVLKWTMVGSILLPALWPLFRDAGWMMGMHVIGGFLWGGINLCAVNFVYESAPLPLRTRAISYFNVLNGCAIGLGVLAGGVVLQVIPQIGPSQFIGLFFVGALLRGISVLLFARFVQEIRYGAPAGLREVVFDLMGQRVVQVLGLLSSPRPGRRPPSHLQ